jgi:hypothetical protein
VIFRLGNLEVDVDPSVLNDPRGVPIALPRDEYIPLVPELGSGSQRIAGRDGTIIGTSADLIAESDIDSSNWELRSCVVYETGAGRAGLIAGQILTTSTYSATKTRIVCALCYNMPPDRQHRLLTDYKFLRCSLIYYGQSVFVQALALVAQVPDL